MGEVTVTHYFCDRCGKKSDSRDFRTENEMGSAVLQLQGHVGGRSMMGDWGGYNVASKSLICFECIDSFQKWLEVPNAESQSQ